MTAKVSGPDRGANYLYDFSSQYRVDAGLWGAKGDGITDDSGSIQAAVNYIRTIASSSYQYVLSFAPGTFLLNSTIDCTSVTNIKFQGSGTEATRIVGTKSWLSGVLNGSTIQGLIDCSSSGSVSFGDLTIDATYGDDGTFSSAPSGIAPAVKADTPSGNFFFFNADLKSTGYCISVATGGTGFRFDLFRCRLFSGSDTIRSSSEKWHFFACDLRATRTDTTPGDSAAISGLQMLGAGEFQLWGCHIHAEDQRTSAGSTSNAVAAMKVPSASTGSAKLVGCTLHCVVQNDSGSATSRFCCIDIGSNVINNVQLIGCDLIYETGTMTQGIVGGISIGTAGGSSNTLRLIGCSIRDVGGSGGSLRGWLVRPGGVVISAGPIIEIGSTRYFDGMYVPTTGSITLQGSPSVPVNGSATLVAGTKTVLLITDSGNSSEAAAVYTAGGTSITGGTNFTSAGFKPGMFTKRSADPDTAWTRIKNIPSAGTMTLEEGYRGTNGTETAKLGTPSVQTQNDTTYRIMTTLTTAVNETINVTGKTGSFFTLTSSNGASTATVDWMLTR